MIRKLLIAGVFLIAVGLYFFTSLSRPQAENVPATLSRNQKEAVASKLDSDPFVQRLRRLEPELKSEIGHSVVPRVEDFMKTRMERLLAAQIQYHLTQREIEQLSEQYAYYQSVRGAFELSIAEIQSDAFSLTAKIPSYPAAGAEIEAMLKQDFRNILGVDRGAGLWDSLGSQLGEDFAQFGLATQTITAKAALNGDGGKIYGINRQIAWTGPNGYPRSVGSDALLLDKQIEDTDYLYLAPLLGKISPAPKG